MLLSVKLILEMLILMALTLADKVSLLVQMFLEEETSANLRWLEVCRPCQLEAID